MNEVAIPISLHTSIDMINALLCYFVLFVSLPLWIWRRWRNLSPVDSHFERSKLADNRARQPNGSTHEALHTCKHCARLLINFSIDWASKTESFTFRLPQTISDVRKAAIDGCLLFKDLHHGLIKSTNLRFRVQFLLATFDRSSQVHAFTGCQTLLERATYLLRSFSSRPFHIRFGRLNAEAGGSLYARLLFSDWKSFELDVTAYRGDRAADFISERPLNYNVASHETLQQARRWLIDCIEGHRSQEHSHCQVAEYEVAPTRLVEIRRQPDGSLHPRIYHSKPKDRIRWATLSYVWGGDQPIKTTKAVLRDREYHLPFSELPKTLQDALIVTDSIGLSFIWIDALCIIQDDPDDLAREIVKMPEIYNHGVCTISASRAGSSEDGFLQPHVTDPHYHGATLINVICPDGTPSKINLAYRGREYVYAGEPIHKRAWCYQERLLSPRILDFNSTQLQWTCASIIDVDGGKADLAHKPAPPLVRLLSNMDRHEMDALWRDTVTAYTRRNLTYPGDKLLALSAVASELARTRFNDDYLAGFWRHSLPQQLAWKATRPRYHRPDVYAAPSWSWASVQDPVIWDIGDDPHPPINIIDCQLQLTYAYAPFGSISGGSLTLQGQMRTASWFPDRGEVTMSTGRDMLTFTRDRDALESTKDEGRTHFLGWVSPDTLDADAPRDSLGAVAVHCLRIRNRSNKKGTRCVFLRPMNDSGVDYQRIAFFEIGDAEYRYDPPVDVDFFKGIKMQIVQIF